MAKVATCCTRRWPGPTFMASTLRPITMRFARATLPPKISPVDLHLGNAGDLPFASQSMDIVYSLGVLHHTDNTVRCISEAYRVLKPGGTFKMALYHFWSLPHLWLLLSGIRNGNLKRLGYRRLLSTVEGGADGVSIAPLVKLYSSRVVRTILSDFSENRDQHPRAGLQPDSSGRTFHFGVCRQGSRTPLGVVCCSGRDKVELAIAHHQARMNCNYAMAL